MNSLMILLTIAYFEKNTFFFQLETFLKCTKQIKSHNYVYQ